MKKHFIASAIFISLCSSITFASGSEKFRADDFVFECNRVLSDGQGVFVHISSSEAQYVRALGTYEITNCVSAYHSCFNIVDESGSAFNDMTIGLIGTGKPNLIKLSENGSPVNGVLCKRIK